MLQQSRTAARKGTSLVAYHRVQAHASSNKPLQSSITFYESLHTTPSTLSSKRFSPTTTIATSIDKITPETLTTASGACTSLELTGDFSVLGMDSHAYYHVEPNVDPPRGILPYENPRNSGSQLRYGGRGFTAKDDLEAFSEMSKADEGPEGTERWGRWPEKARP